MKEKQRYKCKDCGCNFTEGYQGGKPDSTKKLALNLYLEGMGFRSIERILKQMGIPANHTTVIKWVRKAGEKISKNQFFNPEKVEIIELDEMWHFIKKKKKNVGYGLLMTESGKGLSHFIWATDP